MANVGERCEISRQSTPGALYWAAREPSDPPGPGCILAAVNCRAQGDLCS